MKKTKGKVLALVTAQYSCERIINTAKQYAENLNCELTVLTAQPLKATPENRSKDMICLTKLSKNTGKNIKIIYSNEPLKAVIREITNTSPVHIFMGNSGENNTFLTMLKVGVTNAPISVVGPEGIIFTLGFLEDSVCIKSST